MRFLFVHQNFPGQFLHIIRHLVKSGGHEILFICEPNQNVIPGVRKIPYVKPKLDLPDVHASARDLDNGLRRADAVYKAAWGLNYLGFVPDIIIGHHGWGEMLSLRDIWPQTPMLGYFEFYYQFDRADVGFDPEFPHEPHDYGRVRAKNAINHIALNLGAEGQCPTQWQLSTYPDWARPQINLLWEGVDLDVCSPDPKVRRRTLKVGDLEIKPTDKLVTYVSRDLEPYRGFHSMMRALPDLMRTRKDLKVVMIGGDGVSYGAAPPQGGHWRDVMLKEVGSRIDLDRVVFPGRVPYELYRSALRRSDAHVYLTYPFVASWSLREALAMGCPIVGSDTPTVTEFITEGENGILTPFLQPKVIARDILRLIEDKSLTANVRAGARHYAEKHLPMQDYLASYTALIERMTGQHPDAQVPVAHHPTAGVAAKRKTAKRKAAVAANAPATPISTPDAKPARIKPTGVKPAATRTVGSQPQCPAKIVPLGGGRSKQTPAAPTKARPARSAVGRAG